ncbi:MAG: hypothetical protein H6724_17135 [Sandaracinus sp.]|nr:hypothetical protein [Myxococcales bacterium]MCB9600293.1 hypothetical protein [Sandaracinus sp.]MCB9621167.1 hypothetical protein [Sandaracinus sp.]
MSQASNKNPLVGLGIAAVVLGIVLAVAAHLSHESKSEVHGELTLGETRFAPTHCRSGNTSRDELRFKGVDLLGDHGLVVRVLEDPRDGRQVLTIRDDGDPTLVPRESCTTHTVELVDTETSINGIWGLGGHVELDCPEVRGRVDFERCYSGS